MSWTRDFQHGDEVRRVTCRPVESGGVGPARYEVLVGDVRHEVVAQRLADGRVAFELVAGDHAGRQHFAVAARRADGIQVRVEGQRTWQLPEASRTRGGDGGAASGDVVAPMTGTVLAILVEVGQEVSAGDPVAVVSAMKMEHKLTAQVDGVVAEIGAAEGAQVDEGALLVRVD